VLSHLPILVLEVDLRAIASHKNCMGNGLKNHRILIPATLARHETIEKCLASGDCRLVGHLHRSK